MFSYPARLKTDSKSVVYVADWTEAVVFSGRIVAVDPNGHLKFTYNGYPNLPTIFPRGIAITPSNNIIISDVENNALHVLNSRGELLGVHFVNKEYNIERPHPLCMENKGFLLIGNGVRIDDEDSNANIFVVKLVDHFI